MVYSKGLTDGSSVESGSFQSYVTSQILPVVGFRALVLIVEAVQAMTQFIGELTGGRTPHGSMQDGKFVPRIAAPQVCHGVDPHSTHPVLQSCWSCSSSLAYFHMAC